MVNVPEFDLNDPFTPDQNLRSESLRNQAAERDKTVKQQELLNAMWRNTCINDTYEPGSTFKILSAFLPALDKNHMTLATVYEDAPYNYIDTNRPVRNYYKGYKGYSTIREASQTP